MRCIEKIVGKVEVEYIGLGKSEFGRHYVQKSREMWLRLPNRDDFRNRLCAAHTVAVEFQKGILLARH